MIITHLIKPLITYFHDYWAHDDIAFYERGGGIRTYIASYSRVAINTGIEVETLQQGKSIQ